MYRKPRQQRTEVAMIPMPATAPSNSYSNIAFDGASAGTKNPPVPIPSAPLAAAAAADNGNIIYEPTAEYEIPSHDPRSGVRVEPAYETVSRNRPKPPPPPRPRVVK